MRATRLVTVAPASYTRERLPSAEDTVLPDSPESLSLDSSAPLPVLAVPGAIVFPGLVEAIALTQPQEVARLRELPAGASLVQINADLASLTIPTDPTRLEIPAPPIGVVAQLLACIEGAGDTVHVVLQGLRRVRLIEIQADPPRLTARVEPLLTAVDPRGEVEALADRVLELFDHFGRHLDPPATELISLARHHREDPARLADFILSNPSFTPGDRRLGLDHPGTRDRLDHLAELLVGRIEEARLEREIRERTRARVEADRRRHFLREQLREIREALGESSDAARVAALERRMDALPLPEPVRREADQELHRLTALPGGSAEFDLARGHLEAMLDLPWGVDPPRSVDLEEFRRALDATLIGLASAREEILEFAAVLRLSNGNGGMTLGLIGPEGVGRSVIGRAVADALGRPFVRIDLDSLASAVDLIGERPGPAGAAPGRIVERIRETRSFHPVLLLDGLDALGEEPDPHIVQALLSLMDPARRSRFLDRYLGVPLDLGGALVVATAMTPYTIPDPFLDYLELVDVPGYIDSEKVEIARSRLIPTQLERHGLGGRRLDLTDEALLAIIHRYTREPGVWQLGRALGTLSRKLARDTALGYPWLERLDEAQVVHHLGRPPVPPLAAEASDEVGVVMGLAWTAEGGDILPIEAVRLPGGGDVQLTGQLGDVMRESAAAALTFVRSRGVALKIPPEAFGESAMHIHLPEGAIPKDGPSAGLALAVVIASLMTDRAVRHDVAMTGEITLRGRILAVGGIREKVLGAHRAGIRTVILPTGNLGELEDVPAVIRAGMTFLTVDTADQALEAALLPPAPEADGEDPDIAGAEAAVGDGAADALAPD